MLQYTNEVLITVPLFYLYSRPFSASMCTLGDSR